MSRPANELKPAPRFRYKWVILWSLVAVGFIAALVPLRHSTISPDPMLERFLELAGSVLAFTFAANALIRFRGMHDRISLILAFGFGLAGLIEMGANLLPSYSMPVLAANAALTVPLSWMVSRTLLAALLVAALLVDRSLPLSRDPNKEIAWSLFLVGVVSYLTSVMFFAVPVAPKVYPHAFVPRPWDLIPAAMFLIASVGFWKRLKHVDSAMDRALFLSSVMNVACHVAMTQSTARFDVTSTTAQLLEVASFAVVLGGALLDNAKLFDQVSRLAISDPLTGLANYRRLLEVMELELQRAQRTGRGFAVLLLDLDGLKKINDSHGHLIGSQALKRLAHVLRLHCRGMDTAARYGGDEFALVLPEAEEIVALQVTDRIRKRLWEDGQEPQISVSAGVAIYPRDGFSIEKLLNAADEALYSMKAARSSSAGKGKEVLQGQTHGERGTVKWHLGKGETGKLFR
ncbi:MAG TPA: GGDEF domain-containing protein [Candidatus Acidoferrales bacterium]|nr:GGDEF domain-containing protein [Candidatus Acidoferrales bacterium]